MRPADIEELLTYGLIKKGERYFIAFSEHFQNYLRYKEKEESIRIDTWKRLSDAETGLRQPILNVFKEKFGDAWEENYLNRKALTKGILTNTANTISIICQYNNAPDKKKRLNEVFQQLKGAYQRDIDQYGSLALNLTLIDQSYIHQLFDYFILFSWDDLFREIFQKEKRYWKDAKQCLERIRNPMAHQKIQVLLQSEIKRA